MSGCAPIRVPATERRAAYWFPTFSAGIEACRLTLRDGATPAVLRLYDGVESARSHGGDGTQCALIVLDEGEPSLVDATMGVVDQACLAAGGSRGTPSSSSTVGWRTATTRARCRR